jgi:pyrroloquinoline quinone biosynthesis protein D
MPSTEPTRSNRGAVDQVTRWREMAGTRETTGAAMDTAVPSSSRPELASHVRLMFDRARDRHVLLGPESVAVLNRTGADILGLCDGQRTVSEIVEELQGRYNRVVDDEVQQFLARLVAKRYVEISHG